MSAYLFTGWVSQFHKGRFVERCLSLILYGGDEAACRKAFEEHLRNSGAAEDSTPVKIERIVGAPMFDRLITEAGQEPMDWSGISEAVVTATEAAGADDADPGYWVDVNQVLHQANLSPDLEWLRRELPEDIRSGLNWSGEKTYFFLISVLSPLPPPPDYDEEFEAEELRAEDPSGRDMDADAPADASLVERAAAFPELAEKELAVLVRARNSVIAAWLWRRHAASTRLAGNAIRIDGWCGAAQVAS